MNLKLRWKLLKRYQFVFVCRGGFCQFFYLGSLVLLFWLPVYRIYAVFFLSYFWGALCTLASDDGLMRHLTNRYSESRLIIKGIRSVKIGQSIICSSLQTPNITVKRIPIGTMRLRIIFSHLFTFELLLASPLRTMKEKMYNKRIQRGIKMTNRFT